MTIAKRVTKLNLKNQILTDKMMPMMHTGKMMSIDKIVLISKMIVTGKDKAIVMEIRELNKKIQTKKE
jgi:hypothetical protein